jgi:hypothetical protein
VRALIRILLPSASLLLLCPWVSAQTPLRYRMPLPTEPMTGSILFASLVGPPDGYVVKISVHAEFLQGGSFTPDDLQIVLSAPTKPNFEHWVLQGGPSFGWGSGAGLQTGDAATVTLNGEIQTSLPGASVWNLQIEPVPGSGHNGVTGQFTSDAYLQIEYLPQGEGPGVGSCFGNACPCGNDDPSAGCANSTGSGALLAALGLASIAWDDLVFSISDLPPSKVALVYTGENAVQLPFGDGLRCVGPGPLGLVRLFSGVSSSGGTLSVSNVISTAHALSPGSLGAGSTCNFQAWYRDPTGPCGTGSNLSNALRIVIIP